MSKYIGISEECNKKEYEVKKSYLVFPFKNKDKKICYEIKKKTIPLIYLLLIFL
jgi:hypothetical protein